MLSPWNILVLPETASPLLRRFVWAIAGILEAVGRTIPVAPALPHITPALLLRGYIVRLRTRFARLLARLEAGTPPRPRAPVKPRPAGPRATPRLRISRRKSWLAQEIGWFGRGYASQLQHLFTEPETAALIAGCPAAQRMLRPFCRILDIDVPSIPKLPPRLRAPRPRPAKPRPRRLTRREREAILWYPNSEGRPMKLLPKKLPRD